MTGLTINNRCIPQISSCLASSSDSEDSASVVNMTFNRPCTRRSNSSTGVSSEATEGLTAALWTSWELLNTYPKLHAYKSEYGVKKKINQTKKSSHSSKGARIQNKTHQELLSEKPGPSTSNGSQQIYPLASEEINMEVSNATDNVFDQVNVSSTHDVDPESQNTPSSSNDITERRASHEGVAQSLYKNSNQPYSSKGVIPKQQKSTQVPLTSEGENGHPIYHKTVRLAIAKSELNINITISAYLIPFQ